MRLNLLLLLCLLVICLNPSAQTVKNLEQWKFFKGDDHSASQVEFDDSDWQRVTIPHDWAIFGPFDKEIDKQFVKVTQDLEKEAKERTGRTGALPYIGVGWYRTTFSLPDFTDQHQALLTFDGAMSNAEVYVNGRKIGNRPYGYSYFYFDISKYIEKDKVNVIAVRLENKPFSSRWYPGAGLYRKVQIVVKNRIGFKHWGQFITTPYIDESVAKVIVRSEVQGEDIIVKTSIKDAEDRIVAENVESERFGDEICQQIKVDNPHLWSPDTPYLYTAELKLYQHEVLKSTKRIRFGIRDIKYSSAKGFELNGEVTKFKGVCLHHDLGALGAAVNKAALKRQLTILKDMGCNAIRSSHNMPSLEQLDLCDEMGFLFLAESFDEWAKPKVKNGYNLYFNEWAEEDVVNLVRATRNHPCIVMWSSGNEVPDQYGSIGVKRAKFLQDIFHREDPTRPVTVGMDQVKNTMKNGFGAIVDIPGLNYRLPLYEAAYDQFPQGVILGSETASTVSSRGIYKFPVTQGKMRRYDDLQCSSYDLEACSWSNVPDEDFVFQDDYDWVIGEFVWTGFDYLGEPTPYNEAWPSRSSYFGICDLAGLPKDRYYLYRSRWNTKEETLHILPHWNWEGREGEITPVFVYSNYNRVELFVNGVSQGVRIKTKEKSKQDRYRLMWMDVKYQPGEIKVVAFDDQGRAVAQKEVFTAGPAHHLELSADRDTLLADGQDLSFITVSVVDKNGNFCPTATRQLSFKVSGAGQFKTVCNGDPTSLELFHLPTMKTFSGKLVVTVQSKKEPGSIKLEVKGNGLRTGSIELVSE